VAEIMLFVLTLQEVADVPRVLKEARRSLVEGGRVVAVEPDNLGTRFYFDGPLDGLSTAFHGLCEAARAAGAPADLALGPRLPSLVEAAGLTVEAARVHALHDTRRDTGDRFAARLAATAQAVAEKAALPPESPLMVAWQRALDDLAADKRTGWSSHMVPAFVCVGMRPFIS
jgi:hypothetical protein